MSEAIGLQANFDYIDSNVFMSNISPAELLPSSFYQATVEPITLEAGPYGQSVMVADYQPGRTPAAELPATSLQLAQAGVDSTTVDKEPEPTDSWKDTSLVYTERGIETVRQREERAAEEKKEPEPKQSWWKTFLSGLGIAVGVGQTAGSLATAYRTVKDTIAPEDKKTSNGIAGAAYTPSWDPEREMWIDGFTGLPIDPISGYLIRSDGVRIDRYTGRPVGVSVDGGAGGMGNIFDVLGPAPGYTGGGGAGVTVQQAAPAGIPTTYLAIAGLVLYFMMRRGRK